MVSRRATAAEAAKLRSYLGEWRDIADVSEIVETSGELFGFYAPQQGSLKVWREAFRAVEFGRRVGASRIRLNDAPDAVFEIHGREVDVEFTDARSDNAATDTDWKNYADLEAIGQRLPVQQYDPTDECLAVGGKVEAAILAKVDKPYAAQVALAVRTDCFWFDDLEAQVRCDIVNVIQRYSKKFAHIWVLAGDRFFTS